MHICYLTTVHVSKTRGGVERVTDTLAATLIDKGYRVDLISVQRPIAGDEVAPNQYFLPSSAQICCPENEEFLKSFFSGRQIDIVVNQSDVKEVFDLIIAAHGNIPVITAIHSDPAGILKGIEDLSDEWTYCHGPLKSLVLGPYFWLRKLYRLYSRKDYLRNKYRAYYEKSAAVVLLSKRFEASFCRIAGIQDRTRLHAISNPLSYAASNYQDVAKEPIVLFVGRLSFNAKRLDRLLKIWKGIRNNGWKLYILGDGPYRSFYEGLSKKWRLRDVEFKGNVDPLPYYRKAGILCMTSTHEGFGMVITEALQNEVIPMAFGSYEAVHDIIISGSNGYVIQPFSTREYRRRLEQLFEDESLRNSLRNRIREDNQRPNRFSREKITEKWELLFQQVRP